MNKENLSLLSELENLVEHLGEWRNVIVLGGGVALLVYDAYLAKTNAEPVGTTDMDWLIPRKPARLATDQESISSILEKQGYKFRPKSLGIPPVSGYFKEVDNQEIEVEFLTDDRARVSADTLNIPIANVTAQTLSYLEMSLDSVVSAQLPSGVEFNVVSPEAWVYHKGLTFTRRVKKSKQYKDLYGIWFVLTQLAETSVAVKMNLKKIQEENPKNWKNDFSDNLSSWIKHATPNDWSKLIAQDPENRLTEIAFRGLIEELIREIVESFKGKR